MYIVMRDLETANPTRS